MIALTGQSNTFYQVLTDLSTLTTLEAKLCLESYTSFRLLPTLPSMTSNLEFRDMGLYL